MRFPTAAICLLLAATAFAAHGENLTGTIVVKKNLTHRRVTPAVSLYQRGTPVELGKDAASDPLAYERSRVVVWIEGPVAAGVSDSVPSGPMPQVAQLDRRFSPDLLAIPAGTVVSFANMDPIFHNVFSLSRAKSFDLGSFDQGQSRRVSFQKAGIVDVYCHLHPNMEATIVVTPNRWFARVDPNGKYTIRDLPPGHYTVVAWHKYAGTFRKVITIEPGKDTTADFFIPLKADASQEPE